MLFFVWGMIEELERITFLKYWMTQMRRYQSLWNKIAAKETVTITCPAKGERTIRAAIYNEKYFHNKSRELAGLPGFGRINISSVPIREKAGHVRLTINISFSGDNL